MNVPGRFGTRRWPFAALLLCCAAASAQTQGTAAGAPMTLEEANAQRDRAAAMKQASKEQYLADQDACYQKILVSGCLRDAKARHTARLIEARNLDVPAQAVQREAHRAEIEAKEAKRAADRPRRESERREETAEFHSEEARRAAERQRKIAEKEQQAAQYRQKAAAEAKEREERQAEREKREAERAADRARQEASTDAEEQARVPKP